MQFQDILYTKNEGIATITINRPDVRNAFRTLTVDELIAAFRDAWWDHAIGVVHMENLDMRRSQVGRRGTPAAIE